MHGQNHIKKVLCRV